jgi:hypothetical protein
MRHFFTAVNSRSPGRRGPSRAYRSLAVVSAAAMAATAVLATSGTANAGVNPGGGRNADGTPRFVRDAQGIAMQLCANTLICEAAAEPGAIGSYYEAEATAGPLRASWSIEAEFLEDAAGGISSIPAVGNSAVFRAEGLRPNRRYTIRDPWRSYRCRTDNRGRLTNKTCLFEGGGEAGGPLRRGPMKSFLVPRFSVAADVLGGLTGSRVTGSPTGFNRLTITGPRRFKRSTPFFVVAGQLAPDRAMGVLSRKRLRLVNRDNLRRVTKTIRYRNVGTATAVVRTRRTGQRGAFSIDNNCRRGVAPRRACTIVVTYRPVRGRNKAAALVVDDNTLAKPRSIALTGIAPR